MGRDISIVVSAKDNFTDVITTMRNANQSFNKDLTGLNTKLDKLNKNKASLKIETDKARKNLKEAEKQFKKTEDAADQLNYELAHMEYENAKRNLNLISQSAKQTEKDILSLTNAISKADNKAGSSLGSGLGSGETSALSKLASAGLINMVGDALANTANTLTSSAFGSEVGTMFSSVLGSAVAGAAIGSIVPGIGTAIGAAVGGVAGAISGATSIYENKDDAFKSYYQEQYNEVLSNQSSMLENGIDIASKRESDKVSFTTILGGKDKADEFLNTLTDFASVTPFAYDDLTNISRVLLAYGYKQDELLPLLEKIGDAGSANGMDTESMKYVATALGRMQTSGKVTLEYLNPLLERGIKVWEYLSEASGKTEQEVKEMVSKGLVPGSTATKIITDYMGNEYDGEMEKQAQTYAGLVSTLEDAEAEIKNAMGEGYTSIREAGRQAEIEWLSEDSGVKMQDAYRKIGAWQASLENLSEEYEREAFNAVMTGSISNIFSDDIKDRLSEMYQEYAEYAASDSKEAGAKMGALLAEAQAIAQNEYNASEGAQLLLETNKTLANQIKNDTALQSEYWDAGYSMGQQFTKGLASAIELSNGVVVGRGEGIKNEEQAYYNADGIPEYARKYLKNSNIGFGGGYAYGLSYVPYDGYQATLHEGERVLTASENRSYKNVPSVNITGNSFVIREEGDVVKVASEIVRQLETAFDLAY